MATNNIDRQRRGSRRRLRVEHFGGRVGAAHHVAGPVSFLNPTTRLLPIEKEGERVATGDAKTGDPGAPPPPHPERGEGSVYHVWRSRDNRKGRHSAAVTRAYRDRKAAEGGSSVPQETSALRPCLAGVGKMFARFPVWDVSYDVAVVFTLGSVVWVINAFFVWYPLAAPWSEFAGETTMGGGVTACVGATIFEIGSVLLMLEAVNENRSDCFGWALEEALESRERRRSATMTTSGAERGRGPLVLRQHADCRHHHRSKRSFLHAHEVAEAEDEEAANGSNDEDAPKEGQERKWSWWPTWHELKTHYFREIGFLACSSQMFGATVFWISGITGLPPILDSLSVPAENGIFWLPQVVGGTGFIVSSLLFMLETQKKWWLPAPKVLGWHIGFWNFIGALGFTACGAIGFGGDSDAIEYASTLSTFIGSWAFLIGSVIQWYESLDKYPLTAVDKMSDIAKIESVT